MDMSLPKIILASNQAFCDQLARRLSMTPGSATLLLLISELGAVSKERAQLMYNRKSIDRDSDLSFLEQKGWITQLVFSRPMPANAGSPRRLWEIRPDRKAELEETISQAIEAFRESLAAELSGQPLAPCTPNQIDPKKTISWKRVLDPMGEAELTYRVIIDASENTEAEILFFACGASLNYSQKPCGGIQLYRLTSTQCYKTQLKAALHAAFGYSRKRFHNPEADLAGVGYTFLPMSIDEVITEIRERLESHLPGVDVQRLTRLSNNGQNVIVLRLDDESVGRPHPKRVFKACQYEGGMSLDNLMFLAKVYILCHLRPHAIGAIDLS